MGAAAERRNTDLLSRPTCLCGVTMDLVRIEPHPTIQHAEIWTYECRECSHTLVQTFGEDR